MLNESYKNGILTDFESINVGDTREVVKKITTEDVEHFVKLTGDNNPLHVDPDFASKTPFKDIVVHGMLGASFISTVIGTKLPGPGALWVKQNFEFLLPVRIGDELSISCHVVKKHQRDQLIDLEARIKNQNNRVVLTGNGQVKILKLKSEKKIKDKPENCTVALVTGGSGGIGSFICQRLARDGIKVVVHYNKNKSRAEKVVSAIKKENGEATAIKSDLSLKEGAANLVKKAKLAYGPISILVNNASPSILPAPLREVEWEDMQFQIDTQLRSAFLLIKECRNDMEKNGAGRIVNITTQAARETPTANWATYTVAKAALNSLSKQLAFELGPMGITVNCIAPGMTETSLIGDIPEKNQMIIARQTPLRRLALPDDISGAVSFLVSNDAKFITGMTLDVNGGKLMA